MMSQLKAVESLSLPDCWIGAGFVRNTVWDALHSHPITGALLGDVDVVYFSRQSTRIGVEIRKSKISFERSAPMSLGR